MSQPLFGGRFTFCSCSTPEWYLETCGNRVSGKVDGGTQFFVHLGDEFIRFALAIVPMVICLES